MPRAQLTAGERLANEQGRPRVVPVAFRPLRGTRFKRPVSVPENRCAGAPSRRGGDRANDFPGPAPLHPGRNPSVSGSVLLDLRLLLHDGLLAVLVDDHFLRRPVARDETRAVADGLVLGLDPPDVCSGPLLPAARNPRPRG